MSETLGLKTINMMSRDQYNNISEDNLKRDELYAISGSGFGFPSDRYDDLELGASGTTYTAPANGYYMLVKTASATVQYINMVNEQNQFSIELNNNANSNIMRVYLPAKKGDKITVWYTAGGATKQFRFIYAEGE